MKQCNVHQLLSIRSIVSLEEALFATHQVEPLLGPNPQLGFGRQGNYLHSFSNMLAAQGHEPVQHKLIAAHKLIADQLKATKCDPIWLAPAWISALTVDAASWQCNVNVGE
jgi:hypothetical protein